jgi:hypothetical protein
MHINPDSSVQLDEGEMFVEERQDEDNVWRTSTLLLASGAVVTVKRHFTQIGPTIIRPNGEYVNTRVVNGAVVEWKEE